MKKKSSLAKKLASYSALATVILGGSKDADAQILYSEINPDDTTTLAGVYFLDLNNDGIPDFRFNLQHESASSPGSLVNQLRVQALGNNSVLRDLNFSSTFQSYDYAAALYSNTLIGGSDSFKPQEILASNFGGQYGAWLQTDNRFLGLKLVVDSKIYYGWARLSVPFSCDTLIANDYAVDTIPNKPILTGDKCGNYSALTNTVINPSDQVIICGAGTIDLSTDSIAGITYQWYVNSDLIAGANATSYTVDSTGNYIVIATNSNECTDTARVIVSVVPLPEAPVITQTGNSLTSTVATSYQWFFNDVIIPGATNQTYDPTQEGDFSVEIKDANGCTGISIPFAFIPTGISSPHPLPIDVIVANNVVFVQLNEENFLGQQLKIFNAVGDEVYCLTVHSQNFQIDLHQIPAGIYLLIIGNNGKIESRKIVIQ